MGKVLWVEARHSHGHRPRQDLVLEGGMPCGRGRRPISLRDVDPPHWRSAVRAGLSPLQQRLKVLLQIRCVLFRGLPVHAHRPVLARASVRLLQPVDVDVLGQRRERHLRPLPRPLPYPLEFRADGCGARCLLHLSLQRFRVTASPSLHGVPWIGSPASQVLRECSDARPSLAPRFVSFARRYHRAPASFSSPAGVGRHAARPGFVTGFPFPVGRWKWLGLPGSWGTFARMPCSPTPTGPTRQATTPCRSCLPPFWKDWAPAHLYLG